MTLTLVLSVTDRRRGSCGATAHAGGRRLSEPEPRWSTVDGDVARDQVRQWTVAGFTLANEVVTPR